MKTHPQHRNPRHVFSYPLWGTLLGLGAPLGQLLVRWAHSGKPLSIPWVLAEVGEHHEIYSYLVVSTCGAFLLLGILLGQREDRLRSRSLTDTLTHLANRGCFQDRLTEELERSSRYGTPLSLLMIDLDGLKAINDAGGHQRGDRALSVVGACISRACRSSDFGARLGGDEFAILAPSTTASQAIELAQRLKAAVRAFPPEGPVPLSVSVGIADNTIARGEEVLVLRADEALYSAKKRGRDGVALADAEAEAETVAA